MDTIERVAASNFIDHTMIETLKDTLETAGNRSAKPRRRMAPANRFQIQETEDVDRLELRVSRIMEDYRGSQRTHFGLWIEKSHDLCSMKAKESLYF